MFFGRKKLSSSTGVAAAMVATTSTTALAAARIDKISAAAMTPLVLWTAFAVLLSEELWRRN